MKTIATQSMLLNKFYSKYLKNIIMQQSTDNSNNNIDDHNISSMNNGSATLEKQSLLVHPINLKRKIIFC